MQQKHRSAKAAHADGSGQKAGEGALIARLVNGDVAAYRELLEAYWRPLVAYGYRMLDSHDAAEDAVQDVFIGLWKNRTNLEGTWNLRGYLFGFTRNVINAQRRKARVRGDAVQRNDVKPPGPVTPVEVAELGELETAAARAIDDLPYQRREVLVLAHFHGFSYPEIANVLGLSPKTVRNYMCLALRELREKLQPFLDEKLDP